ncbi:MULTISPECIES: DUF3634 family protein [Vibrio]|uniref:DUF3634 family protein n=2 Tax=Vibrio TaxID=662 RepID=A0A7X4LKI3_9VIBR|nr:MULTISPECIES: DUF3634 family protein [Vibrio]MBF9000476.1 DUF3634 family protein [Vibrio nitrifigilis]MZI93256.1 DUF3634 family protein [Vibrio eleionomae]
MWYLIIVAAIVIVWLVADRPVLKVKFKTDKIFSIKGHCPPTFKRHLTDIIEHENFSGVLKVYQLRSGMKLVFSNQVPKKIQQRIRNAFPHQGFKSNSQKAKSH